MIRGCSDSVPAAILIALTGVLTISPFDYSLRQGKAAGPIACAGSVV